MIDLGFYKRRAFLLRLIWQHAHKGGGISFEEVLLFAGWGDASDTPTVKKELHRLSKELLCEGAVDLETDAHTGELLIKPKDNEKYLKVLHSTDRFIQICELIGERKYHVVYFDKIKPGDIHVGVECSNLT